MRAWFTYSAKCLVIILFGSLMSSCQTIQHRSLSNVVANAVEVEKKQIRRHKQWEQTAYEFYSGPERDAAVTSVQVSRVTGIMETDASGYAVGNALVKAGLDRFKRRQLLLTWTAKYGLKNWIVAAATVNHDTSLRELRKVASGSGIPESPFIRAQ